MKKLQAVIILVVATLFSTVEASVRRFCLVAYETRSGYSPEYRCEVQFVTGRELNKATTSFNYSSFSNYALIWFGKGEVAILEIDTPHFGVGEEFDNEDFRKLFVLLGETTATQINSESRTRWRIKGKDWMRWVDPRAE